MRLWQLLALSVMALAVLAFFVVLTYAAYDFAP